MGFNEDKHKRWTSDVRLYGAARPVPKCNFASGDNTVAQVNNPSDEDGIFTAFATASMGTKKKATQNQVMFDSVLILPNEDF